MPTDADRLLTVGNPPVVWSKGLSRLWNLLHACMLVVIWEAKNLLLLISASFLPRALVSARQLARVDIQLHT